MKLIALLALAATGLVLAALHIGAAPLAPSEVIRGLVGLGSEPETIIIHEIRLPRAIAALITGASLGMAGAALQGLFRNPLAEPGVLGIGVSASFAATLVIALGWAATAPALVAVFAAIGALAATALLTLAAASLRSVSTLILVGVGLSSLIGALMSLTLSLTPTPFTMAEIVNWTFGSVANRSWRDVALGAPFILLGAALLLAVKRDFGVLSLGEDSAESLGVDTRRLRIITVLGAGFLTGGSVAIAGAIGFVGIVTPHIVRPWVGFDPGRTLIPASILGGAVLLAADIAIRLIPTPTELRLGVAAALIGAPVFILIAAGRGRV
ncbi:MAG: iron ABC transporter permease [Parvularcula sp.]|nr:iron ABC transporter permease [Parvularcula sp.]